MERNVERKTLSYGKGMTNMPSDLLSDDSALAVSNGFIYKDGEMKPIQQPKSVKGLSETLFYVHKGADYKNIIVRDGNVLTYYDGNDGEINATSDNEVANFEDKEIYDINSINNTLVVSTSDGIYYILYKEGKYKMLGNRMPDYTFKPGLTDVGLEQPKDVDACTLEGILGEGEKHSSCYFNKTTGEFMGYWDPGDGNSTDWTGGDSPVNKTVHVYFERYVENNMQKTLNDAAYGHYMATVNKIKEENKFCFPFFVRAALKLYDGTYAKITAPTLMFPTISMNCGIFQEVLSYNDGNTDNGGYNFRCVMMSGKFCYTISGVDFKQWTDIVKEVVIFASDSVNTVNPSGAFTLHNANETIEKGKYASDKAPIYYCNRLSVIVDNEIERQKFQFFMHPKGVGQCRPVAFLTPAYKKESVIKDELLRKSQFYKLASVKVGDVKNGVLVTPEINTNVVRYLTEQEQLGVDDYHGWTNMTAKKMFAYNKRLNVYDLSRDFYDGFNPMLQYEGGTDHDFSYYTHIISGKNSVWVKTDHVDTNISRTAATWYYYPDPNATEAIIWDNESGTGMRITLQVHPMLNGAYYMGDLPLKDTFVKNGDIMEPGVTDGALEKMDSEIMTSVVNNPFVFEASGNNTVGTGRIIGMGANTEAISQGQFGQYPLLVFTTDGIYGLSVNSEGLYSASYPISREVCNEDSPILATDKLLFFVSKKGLMATSGGSVSCVSGQLNGRTPRHFGAYDGERFVDYAQGSLLAYDYRDSLVRIYKPGVEHFYVYNMTDGTFCTAYAYMGVKAVANDYPDCLLQGGSGFVFSLTGKPNINDDTNKYYGTITTRPLKLGGSATLKSIRDIKHLYDTDDGVVKCELYGSNDCKNWQQIKSLGGKPWKYFTIKYVLSNFKACDSFAGSIVDIQARRGDKMR